MQHLAYRIARRHLRKREAKGVIYTGVFLDDASQRTLLSWWEDNVGPLLSKTYAHHMTIAFRPPLEETQGLPMGERVSMKVVGFAQDHKAQAVLVDSSVPSTNRHPHVTVSTSKGTSPAYSKDLLASGFERVSGPTLKGTVGFYDGKVRFQTPKAARRIAARWIEAIQKARIERYTVSPSGHMVFYFPSRIQSHQPLSWAMEDAEAAKKTIKALRKHLRKELGVMLTGEDEPRFYFGRSKPQLKIAIHARTDAEELLPILEDYIGFGPSR